MLQTESLQRMKRGLEVGRPSRYRSSCQVQFLPLRTQSISESLVILDCFCRSILPSDRGFILQIPFPEVMNRKGTATPKIGRMRMLISSEQTVSMRFPSDMDGAVMTKVDLKLCVSLIMDRGAY